MPHNLGFTSSTDALHDSRDSLSREHQTSQSEEQRNVPYVVELQGTERNAQDQEADYEPYNHRVVTHPTTDMDTLLHLLKGSLGTGILAMPRAFHNAGYVIGLVGTILIGLLCTYCMRILVRSEYELCKRNKVPSMTYPATAEAALLEGPTFLRRFSKQSVHIINFFLMVYQLGTCCVYIVFIARNLQMAFDAYINLRLEIYMAILLVPLVLINYIRNLKYLTPGSTIANGITFVGFGIILYYIFREPITMEGREPLGSFRNFPLFFGTVLFALEAIGVIMPLENEMKTPKSFMKPCGVLNVAMGVITFLYAAMGFFGYIRYGPDIAGSITLNLPTQESLAKAVQILLAIAIFFTHPIQCYVAIEITWNEYISANLEKYPRKLFWEYVVRTVLILLTFILAITIPELDLFISLFGAFCLSALGLAFPAIIHLCAFWKVVSNFDKKVMIARNVAIVIVSVFGLCLGTFTSLRDIIAKFS